MEGYDTETIFRVEEVSTAKGSEGFQLGTREIIAVLHYHDASETTAYVTILTKEVRPRVGGF